MFLNGPDGSTWISTRANLNLTNGSETHHYRCQRNDDAGKITPMTKSSPTPILVQSKLIELGERLARARRARELSQIDLARLSDVGVSTVASLEGGYAGVALGNLLKVMKALDLLEQVDSWLLTEMDEAIVSLGVRSASRKRARDV